MRRLASLLAILSLAVALPACGDNDDRSGGGNDASGSPGFNEQDAETTETAPTTLGTTVPAQTATTEAPSDPSSEEDTP